MNIILLENVEKLGFKNEIVKVRAGYGSTNSFWKSKTCYQSAESAARKSKTRTRS